VRKIFLVLTLAFMFVGIASAFGGESQPVIAVSVGPAIEGHPKVTLNFEVVSGVIYSSVVTISMSDGTATFPDDYGGSTPSGAYLAKGSRFHAFHIGIADDSVPEPPETFYVTFHGATVQGTNDNTVQVTIEDNDS
jgi:Calx-beta domain